MIPNPMMAIDRAVLLAAGASTRLGEPKPLVDVDGQTLIEVVVNLLTEAGLEVTVVTRAELVEGIRLRLPDAHIVVNPEPEVGRTGSIQCGLAALGGGPVLIVPVDMPGFSASTLALLTESEETACPISKGRGGHPVAISAADAQVIQDAAPDTPLRDLIEPRRIEVDDPDLHLNIDTISDVERLRALRRDS